MDLTAALEAIVRNAVRQELAQMSQPVEKRLLRVRDVAQMLSLSERSVRELIDRGEIPTRKVEPYNCILVARSDLDRWIEERPSRRGGHEQKTA